MPIFLSHRGQWDDLSDQNSLAALTRSFRNGFGIETDVRDRNGALVISHDLPTGGEVAFDDVLHAQCEHRAGPLAINIKADGLQQLIATALAKFDNSNYFVFDMAIPDALTYHRAGMRFFTRQSEYEREPVLYAEASGVWLDCFLTEWFDDQTIAGHLAAGKNVCIVSPELHGRDHRPAWDAWATWNSLRSDDVMICTDHPTECAEVFAAS